MWRDTIGMLTGPIILTDEDIDGIINQLKYGEF